MLKITGNTYPFKCQLHNFGCKFDYEQKAYLGPDTKETRVFCETRPLEITEIEDIDIGEEFEVKQQNLRAQNKAQKYRSRSEKLNEQAKSSDISQQEKDFLVLAEPIKIGHHSEGRHRKLIQRAHNKMDKRMELYNKADEAERKAEYRENRKFETVLSKEDKKKRAKEVRVLAEKLRRDEHKVGDSYIGWHTSGVIEKINNRTVKIVDGGNRSITYARNFESYMRRAQDTLFPNQ